MRSQLWPLPVAAVLLALVAGVALPRLDEHVDASLPGWVRVLLFDGDPGAGRTVLDAVSSSLITVTSLTFSLTVVTLQLASSQFSPRLLRTFTSDVFVQATLGVFLATFTFALTVLRSVRGAGDTQAVFVPRISVTLSFLLAIVSVVGLVVFLAHLARQIRVETMLGDVHADATRTIGAVLDFGATDGQQGAPVLPSPPADARLLFVRSSGVLVRVDEDAVLQAAIDHDAHVLLDRYPGSSMVAGTPIGSIWSRRGPLTEHDIDQVTAHIAAALHTGLERTAAQDVGYGLRQLTDVANKALSPGINDPTTAVHALGHISALLCELADRVPGPLLLRQDGEVRVVLNRPDLAALVDVAITQPRVYGAADSQVLNRLFQLLEELAWHITVPQEHIVSNQLDRLQATIDSGDFDTAETEQFERARGRVLDAVRAANTRSRA